MGRVFPLTGTTPAAPPAAEPAAPQKPAAPKPPKPVGAAAAAPKPAPPRKAVAPTEAPPPFPGVSAPESDVAERPLNILEQTSPTAKFFAEMPKSAPSARPVDEGEQSELSKYMEKLKNVERLRRAGKIGEDSTVPTTLPSQRYRALQPMKIQEARPSVYGDTRTGAPVIVRPTTAPRALSAEELRTTKPEDLARQARKAGDQFTAAIDAWGKGEAQLRESMGRSGSTAPAEMPAKAAEQRRRLEAVLNLAAQMREYGWEGTNEQLIEEFVPK